MRRTWLAAAATTAAMLTACSGGAARETAAAGTTAADSLPAAEWPAGEWLRDGAGGPTGVRLAADGTASVINRRGPHYERWIRDADTIRISGHTGCATVCDTYVLDGDTLTLWLGGQPALKYVRRGAGE